MELAYLNVGLKMTVEDQREKELKTHSQEGLSLDKV